VSVPIARAERAFARRKLRSQFSIFGGSTDYVESIFVRLTDECGCTGIGETTPMPAYSGVTVADAESALEQKLLPAVRNSGAGPRTVHQAMDAADPDSALAKAAVDIASFDLLGRHFGVPAVEFLGGAVRSEIPLAWVLGYMPIDQLLAEAETALQQGYRTLKLKVGQNPADDVEAVRQVRAAWPDLAIRIDANQGYDLETALAVCEKLADANLELLEQPVAAPRLDHLAELRAHTEIPIEADESLQSPADARALVAAGACDVFNLKILKPGGLFRAQQVVAIAESAGIPVMIGSMPELGIAAAAGFHLARTLPALPYACELIGPLMVESDVLTGSAIEFRSGTLHIGADAPGLAVTAELQWRE
jgi:o-succinylbenzoate synthase